MSCKHVLLRIACLALALAAMASGPVPNLARAAGTTIARGHHSGPAHHRRHRHHRTGHATARVTGAANVNTMQAGAGAPPTASAPPAAPASCPDGDLAPAAANLDRVRAAILCLINQQRAAAQVGPLRESAGLDAAAVRESDGMVAGNYFDHVAPTGVGLLDRVLGAGYATAGAIVGLAENIAAGSGPLATAAATVAAWMASPGHRANILDAGFRDAGVGVTVGTPALLGDAGAGATYAACFGTAG